MRRAPFSPRPWIAIAILGLTLVGACNLNPQPLPPEGDNGAPGGGDMTGPFPPSGSSGSSGGGSGSGGFVSSSGSGSSSGSSSGGAGSSSDAATVVEQEAGLEDGGGGDAGATLDAATPDAATPDAGSTSDSGSDGPSPDAAVDDASAGDAGCVHQVDCYVGQHPGTCAVCAWPLNYPVCVDHQCRCACDERDAERE